MISTWKQLLYKTGATMKDVLRLERRKNYVEALDSILNTNQKAMCLDL